MKGFQRASLAAIICCFTGCSNAEAQTSGKMIFVANGGGPDNGTATRAVSAVRAELQATNHHLTPSLDAAQLIVTVTCVDEPTSPNGQLHLKHIVRLVLTKRGSPEVISTVQEGGPYPVFQMGTDGAKWGKDFSKVAAKLVSDLKA